MNLQLKNVPPRVHSELRRRAARAGMTMQDYVLRLIRRDQAIPHETDWRAKLRDLAPLALGDSSAELVHREREARGGELLEQPRRRSPGDTDR